MPIIKPHPFDAITIGSLLVNVYDGVKRIVIGKTDYPSHKRYQNVIAIPHENWQQHHIFNLWDKCENHDNCLVVTHPEDMLREEDIKNVVVTGYEAGILPSDVCVAISNKLNLTQQFTMTGSDLIYRATAHVLGKTNENFGLRIGLAYPDTEPCFVPRLVLRPAQEVLANYDKPCPV